MPPLRRGHARKSRIEVTEAALHSQNPIEKACYRNGEQAFLPLRAM
jgi:hypothetical protein